MSLTNGLISYWKLDENSGTTAFDSVGSNDGTLFNASFTSNGIINNAVQFNASTARVEYGDYGIRSNNTAGITFACWIYKTETGRTFVIDQSQVNANGVWAFGVNATSRTLFLRRWESGVNYISSSSISISTNTWQFIGFSFEGGAGNEPGTFFANNSFENITNSNTGAFSALRGQKNAIGNRLLFDTWTDGLNGGRIDEAGVWNRALTQAEVTELYNSGDGLQYPFTSGKRAGFLMKNF